MLTQVSKGGAVGDGKEYRIGDLAEAAGVPVRTLRYYQERKLLPPPRRQGRVGWYSEDHLARLRVIADLLERGHTLEGIRELLSAWEEGRDVASLLGLERAVTAPWSTETPITMSVEEMLAQFPGQVSDEVIRQAVELGLVEVEGDRVTHWSRRLFEATVTLVRAGVPLEEALAVGARMRQTLDELAGMFVRLVTTHVVGDLTGRDLAEEDLEGLAETVASLRPGAQLAMEVTFARAMDRHVQIALDEAFSRLAARREDP